MTCQQHGTGWSLPSLWKIFLSLDSQDTHFLVSFSSLTDWLPLLTLFCWFLLISSSVIFKLHQGLILNYPLLFICSHFLKWSHQVLGLQRSKWLSSSCTSVLNCWLIYPTWHFHLSSWWFHWKSFLFNWWNFSSRVILDSDLSLIPLPNLNIYYWLQSKHICNLITFYPLH